MTRIPHPATAPYPYPRSPVNPSAPQPAPDPQAGKRLHTLSNSPDDAARVRMFTQPAAPFHPYLPQTSLERQGRQAALALLAENRFSKAPLRAALAEHADTPEALAGFFAALGPQNTLEAFLCLDPHERDSINPSGYAPVVDPALRLMRHLIGC